jgi:cytochrome c peroxidase
MGISKDPKDQLAFKTPSLRETASRAPCMHQGQVATLEAVILHYVAGGEKRPSLSPRPPVDRRQPPLGGGRDVRDPQC